MARHRRSSAILDPDQLLDEDEAYMARRRSSSENNATRYVKHTSNTRRSRRGSRGSRHFDNFNVPRVPIVPFGAHMNGIVRRGSLVP